MPSEEEGPQYYFDSAARQWWVFDRQLGDWVLCPDSEPQTATSQDAPSAETQTAAATAATATPPASSSSRGQAESAAVEEERASAAKEEDSALKREAECLAGEERTAASSAGPPEASFSFQSSTSSMPSRPDISFEGSVSDFCKRPSRRGFGSASAASSSLSVPSFHEGDELSRRLSRLMSTAQGGEGGTTFDRLGTSRIGEILQSQFKGSSSEEDSDAEGGLEEGGRPPEEPIVRRVTRRMTFREEGGLAGCLRKAAALRSQIIQEEKGGKVPGAETAVREEAWKLRARETAQSAGAASRARALQRWRAAAASAFPSLSVQTNANLGGKTPNATLGARRATTPAMNFADVVALASAAGRAQQRSRALSTFEGFAGTKAAPSLGGRRAEAEEGESPPLRQMRRRSSVGRVRFAETLDSDSTDGSQSPSLASRGP